MPPSTPQRLHRLSALIFFAAIVFAVFFQVNKGGALREINPFIQDPYDAVGSFAVQGALLIGLLTYARALRLRADPAQAPKARLILRGSLLVLLSIWVTLLADLTAELLNPSVPSYWGNILRLELAVLFGLTILCSLALVWVSRRTTTVAPPLNLTPADGLDDLWALLRVPVMKLSRLLLSALVRWVEGFTSDRLFRRAPWVNPRLHPWRFACLLGLLVGLGLVLAQLQEGLPPSLQVGLLVTGIFIGGEFSATLVGFALLGGYLGLRPPLRHRSK